MLGQLFRFSKNKTTDYLIKFLISVVLLGLACPLVLTLRGDTPVTLQSLVVVLVAISFGWTIAVPAVITYILLGMAGLPVFPGFEGGMDRLSGEFGGFYFGFVAAAAVSGWLALKPSAHRPLWLLLNWTIGHAVILLLGGLWLRNFNPDGWPTMLQDALPGAAIKIAFGLLLSRTIYRGLVGRDEFYGNGRG
ncbi:MAG: biotin transporter BioY [Flavobacteriales bacterium]|nr:biotin transporter BioY [Flavobacteriales bacterium]